LCVGDVGVRNFSSPQDGSKNMSKICKGCKNCTSSEERSILLVLLFLSGGENQFCDFSE
jgi:hypothetical protein